MAILEKEDGFDKNKSKDPTEGYSMNLKAEWKTVVNRVVQINWPLLINPELRINFEETILNMNMQYIM